MYGILHNIIMANLAINLPHKCRVAMAAVSVFFHLVRLPPPNLSSSAKMIYIFCFFFFFGTSPLAACVMWCIRFCLFVFFFWLRFV